VEFKPKKVLDKELYKRYIRFCNDSYSDVSIEESLSNFEKSFKNCTHKSM